MQKVHGAESAHSDQLHARTLLPLSQDVWLWLAASVHLHHHTRHFVFLVSNDSANQHQVRKYITAALWLPIYEIREHCSVQRLRIQVCDLPGGCLRVWNERGQIGVEHDWAKQLGGEDAGVQWAFIALGCWHEVRPVIQGHRLTLVYSLESSNSRDISNQFSMRCGL